MSSFNNNDNNNLKILLHTQISPRAGEKRSNRSLSKLTGALGSAFFGATIMLSPMVANAQDNTLNSTVQPVAASVEANPAAINKVIVPIRDERGVNLEAIQFSAGVASGNGVVVVFYGSDRQAFSETKEAMRRAIAAGKPVRGMMVSDASSDLIEIWADTDFFAGEVAPFDNLSNKMDNTLADAADYVSEMQTERQKRASNAPETTLTALNP